MFQPAMAGRRIKPMVKRSVTIGNEAHKSAKPVKRATAIAHYVGLMILLRHIPGVITPGFMLSPALQAQNGGLRFLRDLRG